MILKDPVKYQSDQYVVEEIKIDSKSKQAVSIQNQRHNVNDIFNKPNFKTPEERLKAKKDTIINGIKNGEFSQANYGLEHYIIFSKIIKYSICQFNCNLLIRRLKPTTFLLMI